MENYISREVKRLINRYGDEIELEIFEYSLTIHTRQRIFPISDRYFKVVATICQDEPPFKDFFATGMASKKRIAIKKAIQNVHKEASY
ncbi:hypothetical protein ACIQZI_03780 [Peribacillus sp. NPDC096379]|uniref:hypothetical protein n=1 Tax=Peribacillus sp. NPDC096379 TaxID=3364393 RepID=UPI0037F5C33C